MYETHPLPTNVRPASQSHHHSDTTHPFYLLPNWERGSLGFWRSAKPYSALIISSPALRFNVEITECIDESLPTTARLLEPADRTADGRRSGRYHSPAR
jgi:hypothetical protein